MSSTILATVWYFATLSSRHALQLGPFTTKASCEIALNKVREIYSGYGTVNIDCWETTAPVIVITIEKPKK